MNKNVLYVAVFGVLCVLAGVLVGAGIARKPDLPWQGPPMPGFEERARHFMGYGPMGHGERMDSNAPVEMLAAELDLTPEQKAKVAEILENTRQDIDKAGKNIRSAIAGIKENSDKRIMDVLTPPQQEKFKDLQKKFKRKCGPMGHGPMDEELRPQD